MAAQVAGLAIAISKPRSFGGKSFEPIPQVEPDAALLAGRLTRLAGKANHPFEMPVLGGDAATKSKILGSVERAAASVAPGGLLVLYLAGHGVDVLDQDGDEKPRSKFDQAFPTADHPVVDDDLASLWDKRTDISIFSIADTCSAESITIDIVFRAYGLGEPCYEIVDSAREPETDIRGRKSGPSIVQFAASRRGTVAGDMRTGGALTGRFTQALLNASASPATLASYVTWFTAADAEVRQSSPQEPILCYRGPTPSMIHQRPAFLVG